MHSSVIVWCADHHQQCGIFFNYSNQAKVMRRKFSTRTSVLIGKIRDRVKTGNSSTIFPRYMQKWGALTRPFVSFLASWWCAALGLLCAYIFYITANIVGENFLLESMMKWQKPVSASHLHDSLPWRADFSASCIQVRQRSLGVGWWVRRRLHVHRTRVARGTFYLHKQKGERTQGNEKCLF